MGKIATQEPKGGTAVRRIHPTVRMPSDKILRKLSAADMQLLRTRLSETALCVFDAEFRAPDAESRIPCPFEISSAPQGGNDDSGVNLFVSSLPQSLTSEQERRVFLRLNYARYCVMKVLKAHAGQELSADAVQELLRWEREVSYLRSEIVRANLPLVLAMAKRTRITGVDPSDLISEGNLALLRAVDKFDCARGFKFSTYACRAILKSFSRVATRSSRYRGYFPTEFDAALEKGDYSEQRRQRLEGDCIDELKSILGKNMANLNDVEQQVIRARFALDEAQGDENRAKTLEQVGEMIGVTKERVRQIQNRALGKLRTILESGVLAG